MTVLAIGQDDGKAAAALERRQTSSSPEKLADDLEAGSAACLGRPVMIDAVKRSIVLMPPSRTQPAQSSQKLR